jgi:hypothetical protein
VTGPVIVPPSSPVESNTLVEGIASLPAHVIDPDSVPSMVKAPVGGVGDKQEKDQFITESLIALAIISIGVILTWLFRTLEQRYIPPLNTVLYA